jgi:hypothetical protein
MHYYDTIDSHAALVRANDTGYLEWYGRGTEGSGNIFVGSAYGVIKTGELILANTTPATGANTGALRVYGGASIAGNLYVGGIQANLSIFAAINNTPIGNAIPSTGAFTYLTAVDGFSTANAYITGGNILGMSNITAVVATFDNLTVLNNTSTGNLTASDTITANNYVVANYGNITGANVVSANTVLATDSVIGSATIANLIVINSTQFGNLAIGGNSITNTQGTDILFVSNAGIVNFDMVTAMRLPSGDDDDRPDVAVSGMIRYNTSLLTIEWYNGTQWMPLSNAITQQDFDGDGTTDTFALSYPATDDSILVNINGTMQFPGIAYDVVGTDIVFMEPPQVGDHIDIRFIGVPLLNVLSNSGGGNTTIITGNTYIPPQALGPGDNPTFAGLQVTGNANIGNVRASGFYWSNGAPFVGLNPYSNANVTAYLTSAASSTTAWLANVITTQGIYWSNGTPYSSGSTYSNANVASYLTSDASGTTANLGNIITTQGIYWANGAPYSSGTGSTYSNANVTSYLTEVQGNIIPAANVSYYLGDATHWWKSLYVSSETIFIGGKPLTANPRSNVVTYNNTIIGGAKFSKSTTPPASPIPGEFWYDTETDVLYKYIQDEDSIQWVDVTGPFGVAGVQGVPGPKGEDGVNGNDGTSVIILGSVTDFNSLPTWGNLGYGDGFIIQATGNLAV